MGTVLDEELRIAGLTITAEARTTLLSLLGGDRQVSHNEIRKLALYAHGKGETSLDASGLNLEPMIDGAFAGRTQRVDIPKTDPPPPRLVLRPYLGLFEQVRPLFLLARRRPVTRRSRRSRLPIGCGSPASRLAGPGGPDRNSRSPWFPTTGA